MKSGIYRIDGPNGKFYIGSAKNISRRKIEHWRDLRSRSHGNPKMQCAWNCHGEQAFHLSIVEHVADLNMLIEREQFWIDALDAVNAGYNVLQVAMSRLGLKASEETKRKQSVAHIGRKHGPMSDEQKAYYSKLYTGRKLSDETKRRMGDARRGKKRSQEVCEKMSRSMRGIPKSDEHKAKLALAKLGKKLSPETIAKMRLSHQNRAPISEETRQRMRMAASQRKSDKQLNI